MAVGFKVKYYWFQVGTSDFLHAFFSNVCFYLEDNVWGARFPFLMNDLYNNILKEGNINNALTEIAQITKEFKKITPEKVIWDIEDTTLLPPWGRDISCEITDLSNYFITSGGENLITMITNALLKAKECKSDIKIDSI